MIRQSNNILYIMDDGLMCAALPCTDSETKKHTPNMSDHLLAKTRKRLEKMGYETDVRHRSTTEFVMTQVTIEENKLNEIILQMRYNLDRLFLEPHCLLMGHRQFEDLVGQTLNAGSAYGAFYGPLTLYNNEKRIYGIQIKVIPGLDNFVMVPSQVLRDVNPDDAGIRPQRRLG